MSVLITGAKGFVGNQLTNYFDQKELSWVGTTREDSQEKKFITIPSITSETDWSYALKGISSVVHLAARVHVMREHSNNAEQEYLTTNYQGTVKLAQDAAKSGVKIFVFISTIKVNGEGRKKPYTEEDIASPQDFYGKSKYKAEQELENISKETGMKVVVLRPTLIYGKGVKGNLESLMKAITYHLPLPVKGITNQRSFTYVLNLSDAIYTAITKRDSVKGFQVYLMSDGESLSTYQLVKELSGIANRLSFTLYIPKSFFKLIEVALRKPGIYNRLSGNLTVSIDKFRNDFNWKPIASTVEGLRESFIESKYHTKLSYTLSKRVFDLFLASLLIITLFIPSILVAILIKLTSKGPILYWSKRIGKNNITFLMPKFRTMMIDAPQVATHLIDNPKEFLTPVGSFLRKSSIDEFPQLWNILIGQMSFVGPRPALYNQSDLVIARTNCKVEILTPGLTGWAQINGRDEIPLDKKVLLDREYLERKSIFFDIYIIVLTFFKVFQGRNVSH